MDNEDEIELIELTRYGIKVFATALCVLAITFASCSSYETSQRQNTLRTADPVRLACYHGQQPACEVLRATGAGK